jgi:hypothetical protein
MLGFVDVRADGTVCQVHDVGGTRFRSLRVTIDPNNPNTSDTPLVQTYIQRELDVGRQLVISNDMVIITGNGDYSDAAPPPGAVTLVTGGTAQPLSTTSVPCRGVLVQAHPSNTNWIWIGIGTAISGKGICLRPGDPPVPVPASDLSLVFAVSVVNGDILLYMPRG